MSKTKPSKSTRTNSKSPVDALLSAFIRENIKEHWAVVHLSEKQKEAYEAGAKDFAEKVKQNLGRLALEKLR